MEFLQTTNSATLKSPRSNTWASVSVSPAAIIAFMRPMPSITNQPLPSSSGTTAIGDSTPVSSIELSSARRSLVEAEYASASAWGLQSASLIFIILYVGLFIFGSFLLLSACCTNLS